MCAALRTPSCAAHDNGFLKEMILLPGFVCTQKAQEGACLGLKGRVQTGVKSRKRWEELETSAAALVCPH